MRVKKLLKRLRKERDMAAHSACDNFHRANRCSFETAKEVYRQFAMDSVEEMIKLDEIIHEIEKRVS